MKTGAMQPLALERVRYVGEPIVAVAATSRAAAEDAARLVAVEYEPLPAVLDPGQALAPGAPLIHGELGDNLIYETRLTAGDVPGAFAAAHRVYAREFTIGRHTGVPIEPRSLVADYEPSTRALTLWISSQVPHMMQAVLAELFSLPEQRVRVIAPDVGGSFGIKIHVYQDDLAACALAQVLGRPVKWVATRRESFLADIHAREQWVRVGVAAAADGTLTGMRAHITAAVGPYSAYPRSSVVEGGQVLRLLPGPYRLRNYDATLQVVAQNKMITSQYRAVGHPIATAVTESMIELIARDLGLDPAELRRRNLVRPDEFPYASATGNVYDSGSYHAALETLLEAAGYDALRGEQRAARAAGRAVGIGLSCFVELTGPGAQFYGVGGAPISGQEGTTVRLEPSGAVPVLTGVTDLGQGMRHALTLRELAKTVCFRSNELRGVEPSLEATVHYTNPGAWTFTNGAHLAVVEVDTETGRVRVLKYVAVDDCGRLVNPALVEGQVRGGVAQGIGGALWEHCVYDDAGQLLTATLMDYAVPTAADLSPIEVHHLETPAPSIAGGYQGAGEGGTAGAPAAILNAVNDALAPFGAALTEQPVTPERVLRALGCLGRA